MGERCRTAALGAAFALFAAACAAKEPSDESPLAFAEPATTEPSVSSVVVSTSPECVDKSAPLTALLNDGGRQASADPVIIHNRSKIAAFDSEMSDPTWEIATPLTYTTIEVSADFVFAADPSGVTAIDIESGEALWNLPIDHVDNLSANNNVLIVAAGSEISGVDLDEQVVLWTTSLGRASAHDIHAFDSGIVVAEGAGSSTGLTSLVGFASRTGAEVWERSVSDGAVWVDEDFFLTSSPTDSTSMHDRYAIEAIVPQTGETRWSVPQSTLASIGVVHADAETVVTQRPDFALPGQVIIETFDTTTGDKVSEHRQKEREASQQTLQVAFDLPPSVAGDRAPRELTGAAERIFPVSGPES